MGKLIEDEQQLSAAVTMGGDFYKTTIDTGATASFISEELAALGMITRTSRQVRLADGLRIETHVAKVLEGKYTAKLSGFSLDCCKDCSSYVGRLPE